MSGQHAVLPPSGAPIWGNCSGWVPVNMMTPDTESEDSRRGEGAHWVLQECLGQWKTPNSTDFFCSDWIDKIAPNGVVVDETMAEGAQVMVDDVMSVVNKHGGLSQLMIEHRVYAPQIHPQNWGTLDCSLYLPDQNLLFLWDYKNGHRENNAKGNLQFVDYIAGLINEFQIDGHKEQQLTVVMRIVQPFCYRAAGPIDEWCVNATDLRPYYNQLAAKAHEAMTTPLCSAGLWCRDCPAVLNCATRKRSTYSMIDYVNEPYQMDNMTGADLVVERAILTDGLKATIARLDAIEDSLRQRLKDGEAGIDMVLETAVGHLEWTIPPEQAVMIGKQFNTDLSKPGVITPRQAKLKVPKEAREAFEIVVKTLTKRPVKGLKLVNAGDTIGTRAFKRK